MESPPRPGVFLPPLRGRSRELGLLRAGYDGKEGSLRWVVGLPGVGKTETVLRAASDFIYLYHRVPPVSEPLQRMALKRTLDTFRQAGEIVEGGGGGGSGAPGDVEAAGEATGSTPTWEMLFQAVVDTAPEGVPLVFVVDDAHRWVESRARFESTLQGAIRGGKKSGRSVHVTLVAPEVQGTRLKKEDLQPPLHIRPLSFRAAWPLLPGATTMDRLRSYTVFGGLPGVLTLLDKRTSLESNLRRVFLDRNAPLREAPITLLETSFQRPNRYAAILAALARGEGDWARVQAGVGDLTSSGQAGPYLKRLEDIGLVEARRSLDSTPRTRSRRYRITDPFYSFWFRFVLPLRESLTGSALDPATPWRAGGSVGESRETPSARGLLAGLNEQVASTLPEICRRYMTFDAMEEFGANARECGSLWGPGYEFPVAGVLRNGMPFYGHIGPVGAQATPSALAEMDAQIRETRYGFGRERRLRVLFSGGEGSQALLRQLARRDDAAVVALDKLAGVEDA